MNNLKFMVRVNVYKKAASPGQQTITYEGRLLGVMTVETFGAIIHNNENARKIFTKETTLLDSIDKKEVISGNRVAVALKKRNGKPTVSNTLFITERIKNISSITYMNQRETLSVVIGGKKYEEVTVEKVKATLCGYGGDIVTITEFYKELQEKQDA